MNKKQLVVGLVLVLVVVCSLNVYAQESEKKIDWYEVESYLFQELKREGGKSDAEIYQAIGYGILSAGNQWGRAAVYFKEAVELDPTLYVSWYSLGLIYSDTEEGQEYFRRAIKANPKYPPSYYWLAYSYCRDRKDKQAIPMFKKYLKVAKDDPKEKNRIRVAEKVLQELIAGEEGENLRKIRRPEVNE